MNYEFVTGNIASIVADAIVLPANTLLKEGAGASTALFEAAGRRKLEKACEKIGSCPVGCAVPTPAFDLKAKYILHTVVSKWIDGEHDEYNMLCAAYLSALELADYLECRTVAFPLLASGNNGFDLNLAFEIAKMSIEQFEGKYLDKAIIVLYGYRVNSIVKEKGFTVIPITGQVNDVVDFVERKAKKQQLIEGGKNIARLFVEDTVEKALIWLREKPNRELVMKKAAMIVNNILKGDIKRLPPRR